MQCACVSVSVPVYIGVLRQCGNRPGMNEIITKVMGRKLTSTIHKYENSDSECSYVANLADLDNVIFRVNNSLLFNNSKRL